MSEAVAHLTFDEWLVTEQHSSRRHEFVGHRAYLMAGGTERHDLAPGLLYEALAPGARAAGCRPFTNNRIVRTPSDSAYYPDVMVACGKAPHRLFETSPVLIVEVLSPSTADTDRREKATAYASTNSLEVLLLVDPDVRRIEAARIVGGRVAAWDTYGPGDLFQTRYGDIDLDSFYDDLEATATT